VPHSARIARAARQLGAEVVALRRYERARRADTVRAKGQSKPDPGVHPGSPPNHRWPVLTLQRARMHGTQSSERL
jgi:hypothetical protein